jgi:hypothetical protein
MARNVEEEQCEEESTVNASAAFEREQAIRIKRDSCAHSWAMAVGGHWVPLPWKDTADAVSVVLWIKERMGRVVAVHVEL